MKTLLTFLILATTTLLSAQGIGGKGGLGGKSGMGGGVSLALAVRSSNMVANVAASTTLTMPTGSTVGDFAVIVMTTCETPGAAPTGWTLISNSSGSYYNGGIYYTTSGLTSGMISSGVVVTTPGTYCGYIAVVDFIGAGIEVSSFISQNSTNPTSVTSPTLSGASVGNTVIWIAAARGSNANATLSRGSLLQAGITGGAGDGGLSIYSETLVAGFSTAVTYTLGTYANGYYVGYIVVAP